MIQLASFVKEVVAKRRTLKQQLGQPTFSLNVPVLASCKQFHSLPPATYYCVASHLLPTFLIFICLLLHLFVFLFLIYLPPPLTSTYSRICQYLGLIFLFVFPRRNTLQKTERGPLKAEVLVSRLRNCSGHSIEICATFVLEPQRPRIKYSRRCQHSAGLTVCLSEALALQ